MARPPQPADTFIHMRFPTPEAAKEIAQQLATRYLTNAKSHGIERLAITRVAEHRII